MTLTRPLVGLQVSRSWRGHGTAMFLELGALTGIYPATRRPRGEAGISIRWSWRVEGPRSIVCGSWSTDRRIDAGIRALQGLMVEDIVLVGRLPEIAVRLSGSRWLHSFMTTDSQPQWTVFLAKGGKGDWLTVQRGRVIRERKTTSQDQKSVP